jgi:hypothetical protein
VEDRQDAVPGGLDQPPTLLLDQPLGRLVVEVQQLSPPLITKGPGSLGRPHDVGEQHRDQQPPGRAGGLDL